MVWHTLLRWLHGPARKPRLLAIYTSECAGGPIRARDAVEAVAGRGLAGDRYWLGTGHWHRVESCEVTLITEEDLRRARRRLDVALDQGQHRRNLVLSGIRTRDLQGHRFRIGAARFAFLKPRPPCGHLNQVSGENLAKALGHNSGICLSILESGIIRVGDTLVLEPPEHD